MQKKRLLVAFDFDYTLIADNSDTAVCKLLQNIPPTIENLYKTQGWTVYMNEIFKLVYENGFSKADIIKAVTSIQPVPNSVELLRSLRNLDCEVIIISDANTVFIDEWLKTYGVEDCVNKVYSNPASFENGRLQVKGYHNQDWCRLSAKNICKGHLLFEYIEEREKLGTLFRYIAYCGDGKNDFCPVFRLRAEDIAFARRNFTLDKMLKTIKIKAKIVLWSDTSIILNTLQQLCAN